MNTRKTAMAGRFYPSDPQVLSDQINSFLKQSTVNTYHANAIISPHAGYIYSGEIAASAYKSISANTIKRVFILGPSHHVAFVGFALPSQDALQTPLGRIPIDRDICRQLGQLSHVNINDDAHRWEHSVEVQLPFLQTVLTQFSVIPIVVGDTTSREVCEVLHDYWQDKETLIVVSSDLSHFHTYSDAQRIDQHTSQLIENFDPSLNGNQACGYRLLNGLLTLYRNTPCKITTLDMRNSGDTAGSRKEVVGYGAYAIH